MNASAGTLQCGQAFCRRSRLAPEGLARRNAEGVVSLPAPQGHNRGSAAAKLDDDGDGYARTANFRHASVTPQPIIDPAIPANPARSIHDS